MSIKDWIKGFLSPEKKPPPGGEELDLLRKDFKRRHHHFRLLLASNRQAMENMAEIEQALLGERAVSIAFVRSRCARASINVFQIIKHLTSISPNKFEQLFLQFEKIQENIKPFIDVPRISDEKPLVFSLDEVSMDSTAYVGGKMAALGELKRIRGINAPNGFVVGARGYQFFMEHDGMQDEIDKILQSAESELDDNATEVAERIQKLIMSAKMPTDLEAAVYAAFDELNEDDDPDFKVAARSSAIGEDSSSMSFAGQYHSVLNVDRQGLIEAYKEVVAGKYTSQAISYRIHYGLRDDEIAMCVGFLPMIQASFGGVTYTRNPLQSDDDKVAIYAVLGLPKAVVDGSGEIDAIFVSREKPMRVVRRERGSSIKSALDDDKAIEIAKLALTLEENFGDAQDIEWAVDKQGKVVILQSRPLMTTDKKQELPPEELIKLQPLLSGGVTASGGRGCGPVFLAMKASDKSSFARGSVLVAEQAHPHWASLLDKAAGVITEQGGVACHLANVAREFKVPALFNVSGATSKLRQNKWVTLDADNRVVFEGKADIPEREPASGYDLAGSPVYESLKGAAAHITPLNLLEPDSPDFAPANCSTLHDVTRFCHEMANREMFRFGVDHKFPEKASRRLFTDVATQFWVIDLDDGLREDASDPYFVKLEEIVSVPMLALWRGMQLIPWEGPPPVDARGFFQVLAGSTMDPNLNLSAPSERAEGSYFMISKNYCSLQSKFGFHFALVEALVSERNIENYIKFQFNGGGASTERQTRRLNLIADILLEKGFRANVKLSSLDARIEGHDKERMERSMAAIGYLLIHTKQLDMVMESADAVARYKEKMMKDLEGLG